MNESLPRPMVEETQLDFVTRAMEDLNMIREYSNMSTRLDVANARWNETQLSRNFYVAEVEIPTDSAAADPTNSRGKQLPERGEPLTDGESQKY